MSRSFPRSRTHYDNRLRSGVPARPVYLRFAPLASRDLARPDIVIPSEARNLSAFFRLQHRAILSVP